MIHVGKRVGSRGFLKEIQKGVSDRDIFLSDMGLWSCKHIPTASVTSCFTIGRRGCWHAIKRPNFKSFHCNNLEAFNMSSEELTLDGKTLTKIKRGGGLLIHRGKVLIFYVSWSISTPLKSFNLHCSSCVVMEFHMLFRHIVPTQKINLLGPLVMPKLLMAVTSIL